MKPHDPTLTPAATACQPDSVRVPLFRVVLWAGWAKTNGEARRVVRGGSIRVDFAQELDENRLISVGQYVSTLRQGYDCITEYLVTTDSEVVREALSLRGHGESI